MTYTWTSWEEVTAAEDALRETFHSEHPLYGAGWNQKMAHVLAAVSPAIAARVLREAADDLDAFCDGDWLRARAEAVDNND